MTAKAPRLTLYTTAQCPHCRQLKTWLSKHGFRYQEFDVQRNARAQKAFARLGARAVPVLLIGDKRVDGFDTKKLSRLLKIDT